MKFLALHAIAMLLSLAMPAHAQQRITPAPANATATGSFTNIVSLRELSDGSVLVTDFRENRLAHVHFTNREPTNIGRVGGGPGEFVHVGWVYPLAGDTSLFTDSNGSRWSVLVGNRIINTLSANRVLNRALRSDLWGTSKSGRVLGARDARTTRPRGIVGEDSLHLLLGNYMSDQLDTIATLRGRGRVPIRVLRKPAGNTPGMMTAGNPVMHQDRALLFHDEWIAVARVQPYRVDWRAPDGRWIRGPNLPFTPIAVDQTEKCFAIQRVFRGMKCDPSLQDNWPAILPAFIDSRYRPILLATPSGDVMITRTPTARARTNRYDIVNRQGQLTATLDLPLNQFAIGFGTNSLYILNHDEFDLQTITRHRWPT